MPSTISMQRLSLILLLVIGAIVLVTPVDAEPTSRAFDPTLTVVGVLPQGTLGLPGEPITWIITVTNNGESAGTDLVLNDVLRDELRIEQVEAERGWQDAAGQVVEFTIPRLEPGETVGMQIVTTVLRGPADGVLTNRVTMRGQGPTGEVVTEAVAEVYVPTGLPATGYPLDENMPGAGEPSLEALALLAFGAVALTAYVVYRRGQWML